MKLVRKCIESDDVEKILPENLKKEFAEFIRGKPLRAYGSKDDGYNDFTKFERQVVSFLSSKHPEVINEDGMIYIVNRWTVS